VWTLTLTCEVTGAMAVDARDEQHRSRDELVTLVRAQVAESECWQHAENVVIADVLRRRLEEVGIAITPEVAAALMAGAMVLVATSEEFGGDYRDALADLAALGLELLDG
jgi:hypothetical protein